MIGSKSLPVSKSGGDLLPVWPKLLTVTPNFWTAIIIRLVVVLVAHLHSWQTPKIKRFVENDHTNDAKLSQAGLKLFDEHHRRISDFIGKKTSRKTIFYVQYTKVLCEQKDYVFLFSVLCLPTTLQLVSIASLTDGWWPIYQFYAQVNCWKSLLVANGSALIGRLVANLQLDMMTETLQLHGTMIQQLQHTQSVLSVLGLRPLKTNGWRLKTPADWVIVGGR